MRSIELFSIKFRFLASPTFTFKDKSESFSKSIFDFVNSTISGFISIPITFLPVSLHSINVVPEPHIWSKTVSPSCEYLKIKFLGIWGAQLPLNFELCVAQLPLLGKDQTVVVSSSKSTGSIEFLLTLYLTGYQRQKFDDAKRNQKRLEQMIYEISLRR